MQDMVRVVVDAMGGDNAPGEIVKGAVEALNAREDIFIYLTGRKPVMFSLKRSCRAAAPIAATSTASTVQSSARRRSKKS